MIMRNVLGEGQKQRHSACDWQSFVLQETFWVKTRFKEIVSAQRKT
jgi:hypothetical protein